jgi:glyoxylase-like metal-dependent hydrolase (beta-lactamase superfamily II)
MDTTTQIKDSPAKRALDLLGGASSVGRSLHIPVSTASSWLTSGMIPAKWQGKILALAKQKGAHLRAEDLIAPAIPQKVGQPKGTGAIEGHFSTPPAPMPQREIEPGLFLREIKALSKNNTVVCFAGVGSAFAKRNDQTSLIIAKNGVTILVDVGTTIPQALYRNGMEVTDFDYFHVTHAHADHIGGLEELMLKHRYILKHKLRLIISPAFEQILWENTLKGGSQINELGLLKFRDLIEPIEPSWVRNSPRETYQVCVEGIHLTIFRTIHTPGDTNEWEKAFWSTGLIIDGQVLFSADTRFDPTLFTDLDLTGIETIYHDCQLFNPNNVHAPYDMLKELPSGIKTRMYLTHYGDSFENFDPKADGFAGFAQAFVPYLFNQK